VRVAVLVPVFVVAATSCSSSSPKHASAPGTPGASPPAVEVVLAGAVGRFQPSQVTVARGAAVQWHNTTSFAHTVTFDAGDTAQHALAAAGGRYSFTFSKAGTFAYHCSIHPSMTGAVIVQ
jgi:plastocyanin